MEAARTEALLTEVQAGKSGVVRAILGGQHMRDKLVRMGIREGAEIAVVKSSGTSGPVVVCVAKTQLALGRGMAAGVVLELPNQ